MRTVSDEEWRIASVAVCREWTRNAACAVLALVVVRLLFLFGLTPAWLTLAAGGLAGLLVCFAINCVFSHRFQCGSWPWVSQETDRSTK